MTVFCPNCGKPNTDNATQCVSCGTLLTPKAPGPARFKGTMMMTPVAQGEAESAGPARPSQATDERPPQFPAAQDPLANPAGSAPSQHGAPAPAATAKSPWDSAAFGVTLQAISPLPEDHVQQTQSAAPATMDAPHVVAPAQSLPSFTAPISAPSQVGPSYQAAPQQAPSYSASSLQSGPAQPVAGAFGGGGGAYSPSGFGPSPGAPSGKPLASKNKGMLQFLGVGCLSLIVLFCVCSGLVWSVGKFTGGSSSSGGTCSQARTCCELYLKLANSSTSEEQCAGLEAFQDEQCVSSLVAYQRSLISLNVPVPDACQPPVVAPAK